VKRMSRNYLLVSGFWLAICGAVNGDYSTAKAADWPNWRGPNHNGISNESGWVAVWPEDGPKALWKKSIGTGFSSLAVSRRHLYAMGNIDDRDIVYCLDAETGQGIWEQSYPCPVFAKSHEGGPSATPTVDGSAVYTFSKKGDVYCLEATTGKVIWHKNVSEELGAKAPDWYFAGSVLVIDDILILSAGTWGIALNKTDGSFVWQNGKGPPGYATAVPFTAGGRKCIAIFGAKGVAGLVAATGEQLWQFGWETPWDENIADPIVSDDKVFISSGCGTGCALLKFQGGSVDEIWRNRNMQNHLNSSVLWQGHLYGFDESELKCLDFKTGRVVWSQEGLGKGSLMAADGKLIILSEKGRLVIAEASPEGFKELSSAQILKGKCWTVPVLANGRIYARNASGDLVCVDVRAKAAHVSMKTN